MKTFALLLLTACVASADPGYKLSKVWKTESGLEVPECALFRPTEKVFYVSNVAGAPAEKNGKGFISKVDLDGKIVALKWATGLNAPKGMAISAGSLFVADIDALVQIDLTSGHIVKRYVAENSVFLNDVAAAADGTVFVGDSSEEHGAIYRLSCGELTLWLSAPQIERPNGLHMMDGQLMAGHARNGKLLSIDPATGKSKLVAQTDSGIDGLKPDGRGNWFTSNWKGRLTLVTAEGQTIVLLDTTGAANAADFEYLPEKKMIVIPTFFDNGLVAYAVE